MRYIVLEIILFTLLFSAAGAEIGPFTQLGSGHFAGKMASYASGDTLAMVFYDNPGSDPSVQGWIVFRQSLDCGLTWSSQNVVQTVDCLTKPTLFYTPQEILITYTEETSRLIKRSVDGGATWQTYPEDQSFTGRTFENSPYVERHDGELKLFALDLPYPEYDQDRFSHPDRPEELLAPQLFTDSDWHSNNTWTFYHGMDEIPGIVRSNSDILIKRTTGGYDGWPIFNAPVITGGEILSFSGAYPADEIFRGGLIEYAPYMLLDTTLDNDNIQIVGPPDYDPNNIMLVQVDGNGYEAYLGVVLDPYRAYADVYSSYPPPDADNYLFRNLYDVRDTVWIYVGHGACINSIKFVNSKLWISGDFQTHQTWVSADTMYILNDITLRGTPIGTSPEGNLDDSVNLISNMSIVIKYGYKDPVDSLRRHGFCGADTVPAGFIYANLYALGQGNGNPRADGVFTFEYQHPHPSVPMVHLNNIPYSNIDLHRYHFPQTTANPWPPYIDYPWYNPLWPEAMPYLERGTLWLWGSVNQRRRGYLHRAYYDLEHPSGGVWNQTLDFYGGSSSPQLNNHTDPVLGIELGCVNYPGATGSGVGYKVDYRNDSRNYLDDLGYGEPASRSGFWKLGMSLATYANDGGEIFDFMPYYKKAQLQRTRTKGFVRNGDNALYSVNDLLLFADGDDITDWSASTVEDGNILSLALDEDDSALVYQHNSHINPATMRVRELSPDTGNVASEYSIPVNSTLNDITIIPDGHRIMAVYDGINNISVGVLNDSFEPVTLDSWNIRSIALPQYNLATSRLYLLPSGEGTVDVFLWLQQAGEDSNLPGTIFHARANLTVPNDDPVVPELPSASLTAYPNPATRQMNIKLQTSSSQSPKLAVYNLRGQLVRSLDISSTGEYETLWNGLDNKGMPVSSGIYFLRLFLDNKLVLNKRVCWM